MRLFSRALRKDDDISLSAGVEASLRAREFDDLVAGVPHSITQIMRMHVLVDDVDRCGFPAAAQAMRERIPASPARTTPYNPCDMEKVTLVGGLTMYAHAAGTCAGYWCTIHYNSPHHMVRWAQDWDSANQRMMRLCSHGNPHPDPDDLHTSEYLAFTAAHAHVCDGCCKRPFDLSEY